MKQALVWCPIDIQRVVVVLENLELASMLVNLKLVQVRGLGWVELFKWTPDLDNCSMEVSQEPGRIGICELQWHLWSLGFFKAIGSLFGEFCEG